MRIQMSFRNQELKTPLEINGCSGLCFKLNITVNQVNIDGEV